MKLRKPCPEHNRYEEHDATTGAPDFPLYICPGGEFLTDNALVIPRDADGNLPSFLLDVLGEFGDPWTIQEAIETALKSNADHGPAYPSMKVWYGEKRPRLDDKFLGPRP